MDKDTYRLNRLRKLVDDAGGPAKFARLSRSIDPNNPIDPTHVSQVLNGHRSFKETAVRNMEIRAGLPPGYFEDGWHAQNANKAEDSAAGGYLPRRLPAKTQREKNIEEITRLASLMDATGLGMLMERAQILAEAWPMKTNGLVISMTDWRKKLIQPRSNMT